MLASIRYNLLHFQIKNRIWFTFLTKYKLYSAIQYKIIEQINNLTFAYVRIDLQQIYWSLTYKYINNFVLYFPILDKVSVVKLWKRYIYRCWQLTWDESWRIIIFHSERAVAVSPICRKSQHRSFRQGAPCRRARRTKMICSSRVLPQAAAWPVRRSIASCLTTLTIVIRFPRTRSVRTSGPPRSP